MNKISIIIPVYKVEAYIGKCIESILSQSYSDFELLLIDDGSPDKSGEICDEYTKKDTRVNVIHIKNGGPSNARNIGLTMASGSYVCFIDSDDWVEKDFLLHLIDNYEKNGFGVVIAGHIRDGKTQIVKSHREKKYLKKDFPIMCDEANLCNWGYSHDKLYDLKVIKDNDINFPVEIKYSEDLIFLLRYIQFCDWVKFVPYTDYHYVIPEECHTLISSYNSYVSEYLCYKLCRENLETICDGIEQPKAMSWCSYLLLRAIKTQYRKGQHFLCRKDRIDNLREIYKKNDVWFALKYSLNNLLIDKISLRLISKRMYIIADVILRLFFLLRYSSIIKFICKK